MTLELGPADELWTCISCECYWVNEVTCFVCDHPGTILVHKSNHGDTQTHRRLTQQILNVKAGNGRQVCPSLHFRTESIEDIHTEM